MKAMQDVHLCMYVCMYGGFNLKVGWNIVCMYAYMCVCIYVSQGDFRLMSFTAGRCGTPLIVSVRYARNDQ